MMPKVASVTMSGFSWNRLMKHAVDEAEDDRDEQRSSQDERARWRPAFRSARPCRLTPR